MASSITGCDIPDSIVTPDYSSIADFPVSPFAGTYPNCTGTSAHQDFSGRKIVTYKTRGLHNEGGVSLYPGAGGANVYTKRATGPCQGSTNGRSASFVGGDDDVEWHAVGGTGALASCYSDSASGCGYDDPDSCAGKYAVQINPGPSGSYQCSAFDEVWVAMDSTAVLKRPYPSAAEDSSGSGRFALVPVWAQDVDKDGLFSVVWAPVMVSGSGTMTSESSITAIDEVDYGGATVRVAKPSVELHFDGADQLDYPSTVSYALTGSDDFSTGQVQGNAWFVANEVPQGDVLGLEVDLAWSAGTGGDTVSRPQGWVVDLDALGCGAKQKLTLRYLTSPNRVEFEQYGSISWVHAEPTVGTQEGQAFAVDMMGLEIDGVVLSTSSQQAVVRFDMIRFNGEDVCETGSYTLPAE